MYRYDYVLRLIERLGQILRTLRDRLLQRELTNDDLRQQVQEIAREAGLDLELARRLDPGTLVTWLAPIPDQVDEDRVWLMAELLYVEALAGAASGDGPQAAADARRALALFARLKPTWRPGAELATAGERVAELEVMMRPGSDPAPGRPDDGVGRGTVSRARHRPSSRVRVTASAP